MIRTVWHWRPLLALCVVVLAVGYGATWVLSLDTTAEYLLCFALGSLIANLWMLRFDLWHFEFD